MAQAATANSTRALALQRRKAMSVGGKAAIKQVAASSGTETTEQATAPAAPASTASSTSAREASLARRKAMSVHGKTAAGGTDRTRTAETRQTAKAAPAGNPSPVRSSTAASSGAGSSASRPTPQIAANTAKAKALARRKALSTSGKAAIAKPAQAAAAAPSVPKLSGRELAQAVREQRSRSGKAVQKQQPNVEPAAAQDASWKVGASTTNTGQTVTGTMVGRQKNMTGDEPSTCRAITGTDYLGADIFNEFCQNNVMRPTTDKKVEVTSTSHGNLISGNRMGRGKNVTGNESGSCQRVTGNQYTSSEQWSDFCSEFRKKTPRGNGPMASTMKYASVTGTSISRSGLVTGNMQGADRALTGTPYTRPSDLGNGPSKVLASSTFSGGVVTGSIIGRRAGMTGDDRGDCTNVTGDEYIGSEQYKGFCKSTPLANDTKVGVSKTLNGLLVTGNLASRSDSVTGNEPGTCKAVTGTPYASGDQYEAYCDPSQSGDAEARMQSHQKTYGMPMTGLQPGIGGHLTGAHKGACDPVTGTPYVGSDQVAASCPTDSADVAASQGADVWGDFSVRSPAHASRYQMSEKNMTGSQFEGGNQITGSFGKGAGKLTGTEEARFEQVNANESFAAPSKEIQGRKKSRITGEGQDTGLKITGDDWDRNKHVTGTEGLSSARRNPTQRGGPMSAMQSRHDMKRPSDIPTPVSKVTGGSGNTDQGSLITYSGGARG